MSGAAGNVQFANLGALMSGGSLPVQIAVGATALYDLRSGWDGQGSLEGWEAFQEANAQNLPPPGPAWPFIKELTRLNQFVPDPMNHPLVRVHLISRMAFAPSERVIGALNRDFRNDFDKTFSQSFYADGEPIAPVLMDLGVHLYLAGNAVEAYRVMKEGIPAVHMKGVPDYEAKTDLRKAPLLVCWDFDGVVVDDASEQVFQNLVAERGMDEGVLGYGDHETKKAGVPLGPGPLFPAFLAFCGLRSVFPKKEFPISPFRQAIVTARGLRSQRRVHTTLKALGQEDLRKYLDPYSGMSGGRKGPRLKRHRASLHLEDGSKHVDSSLQHGVPAGHVIAGIANKKMIEELEAILNPKPAEGASKPDPANQRFFWVDFETTGADREKDAPLEMAVIVTDGRFNVIEKWQRVIYQPPEVLAGMNDWARGAHQQSGLLGEIANGVPIEKIDEEVSELAARHFSEGAKIVLFGNSVGFDQRFVERCLPRFAKRIHYRIVDVTSWEIPFRELYGVDLRGEKAAHRALADIETSIKRLQKLVGYVKVP